MIREKRDSLERFIREQTLGPGINGYRFVDVTDEELVNKNIKDLPPAEYSSEIIDIVPAAVYSTGILFPDEIKAQDYYSGGNNNPDNNEIVTTEGEEDEIDSQNSSLPNIEDAEGIQIDQMYPKIMGFTCCLDEGVLATKSIEITVSARYYRKVKFDVAGKTNDRIGLHCEVEKEKIEGFLQAYGFDDFSIKTIGPNTFVFLRKLKSEEITQLKSRVWDVLKSQAEQLFDKANSIIELKRLSKKTTYLSSLKSTIYYELKISVISEELRASLYEITQEIELLENISDHLRNLLDINSGGYGLWQSEIIERIVRIENIVFPKERSKKSLLYFKNDFEEIVKVLRPDETVTGDSLRNIFLNDISKKDNATISMNIQLSRDTRKKEKKIFLKVQLVNTSTPFNMEDQDDGRYFSTFNEVVNQRCFFGVKLSISNVYLIPYNKFNLGEEVDSFDEETRVNFTHRQFEDYGVGHGCSVMWNAADKKIGTEYLPFCDTPDIEPIPRNKSKELKAIVEDELFKDSPFIEDTKFQEFKWLSIFSSASNEDIINGLEKFVDSYGRWISIKRKTYTSAKSEYSKIANQELDKCEKDYKRMGDNINVFLSGEKNVENLESFKLMNAAMFMQLWHTVKVNSGEIISYTENEKFKGFNYDFYSSEASDKLFYPYTQSAAWRAFQLAFILLNLDGIFREESDESWEKRNQWVDLVWFPTGGGKTEAYLGLIALTIINRRKLHKEMGGGTAAIMRYTLRLLTLQQFQRATLVIMSLELLRRWELYDLGVEPINIGLWVGKHSIPNSIEELQVEYQKLSDSQPNKIPFSSCPWCNSKLRPSLTVDSSQDVYFSGRLHLHCDNEKCSFTEPDFFEGDILKGPIPVCLCDDTIYLHPPALLFGTVDKFAQLAHKVNDNSNARDKDSRRIFGRGNWELGKPKRGYYPPDLIIQDELHLLQGPLGSAVGLFESAVDQLCTREDGTRPKVISSTATTRNTDLQIAALFDRKVDIFPKPGVECDDSFFAFYKRKYDDQNKTSVEYVAKRRYLGIIPTGRTQIWMQMRLAAILLTHRAVFELQQLSENSPIDFDSYKDFSKAMDYNHTIISYFNSLKEVGKTQSQVQSYILKELRRVFSRVIRPQKLMQAFYTYGPIVEAELTGRLSGEEVKNELKNVQDKWDARNRLAHVMEEELISGNIPPEFVVATNMISVGIDVSRFNLIIMNSMPRNTAEYIQASSRVARDSFGLVLTVHHPFRARDVSHYEKFIEFHEKMYSYVEPISITPFTKKAIERYLGLFLATMIRHSTKRFVNRSSAVEISKMDDQDIEKLITDISEYFFVRKDRYSTCNKLIQNLLREENATSIQKWIMEAFKEWKDECNRVLADGKEFVFNNKSLKAIPPQEQLYVNIEEYEGNIHSKKWQVPMSLRVIEPEAAISISSK
jgi:hypothetical protein